MKKVFLAVALILSLGFSMISCDPNKARCWAVTFKGYVNADNEIVDRDKILREEYFWGTMDEAEAYAEGIMFSSRYASQEINDMAGLISQKNCH